MKTPVATEATPTPHGIIRKGQRRPYYKPTRAESDARTEWIALKIAIQPNLTDGELKALVKERFNIAWNAALDYIGRAKKLLADRANINKQQAQKIGVNALLDIIQNGSGSERNAAIRLWTDIFGNEAPKESRIGNPDGSPIEGGVVFVLPAKEKD